MSVADSPFSPAVGAQQLTTFTPSARSNEIQGRKGKYDTDNQDTRSILR
jgi:hypothetical protein